MYIVFKIDRATARASVVRIGLDMGMNLRGNREDLVNVFALKVFAFFIVFEL